MAGQGGSRLKPWMIVSAVWIAPALFNVIGELAQPRLHGWNPASLREIIWAGGDWLVYAILTPPIFWVSRRWPIARPRITNRVTLHLVFALLFCIGWATSGKLLDAGLSLAFGPEHTPVVRALQGAGSWREAGIDWLGWVLVTLPFGCVVYFSIAGIAHAIRYFMEARDREVQVARLAEQLAGARFTALQAQVNPHFLFNTLNTIAVLVRDNNRAGAVQIVEQLSDVLRRTIRHRAAEVRLDDELDLVRQYLAIEQVRFSDRLRPSLVVDDRVRGAAVPSFAVQHLVENAIRHGIARKEDAGVIEIRAQRDGDDLIVTVRDDGPGVAAMISTPAGHGLMNTRERLTALYGHAAALDIAAALGGGTVATLRVPYRELPPEAMHAG